MGSFVDYAEILIEGGGIKEILEKLRQEADVDVAWKEYWTGETLSSSSGTFSEHVASY